MDSFELRESYGEPEPFTPLHQLAARKLLSMVQANMNHQSVPVAEVVD